MALETAQPEATTIDVERLSDSVHGPVIVPGDEGYDEARSIWNGAIDTATLYRVFPGFSSSESPLTDSNRRLLTMASRRQPVATHGNGFRLLEPFSSPSDVPLVATGCDRSAS